MTVEIIRPENRGTWLAARKFDVTASVAGALLDVHPHLTKYQLWADKTGRSSLDDEETDAMARGRYLEPVGVAMLRDKRPDWRVEYAGDNTYYRDGSRRIGATPDAFGYRPDAAGKGIIQIKSAAEAAFRDHWFDHDTHDVIPPDWILVQASIEAHLTGATWAVVAVVVVTWRGNLRLHVVDVPLRPKLWERILRDVASFWALVEAGGEPPIDWSRDGGAVLDVYRSSELDRRDLTGNADLDTAIAAFVDKRRAGNALLKDADAIKPQIIHALGNSSAGLTDGWEIDAPTVRRGAYQVKETEYRSLKIKPRQVPAHANF